MTPTSKPLRVGNAQAFWGDRTDAAAEMLAREPGLNYLSLDYLAEVSMSILAMQRERDPHAGFAREFVDVVRSLAPYWSSGGRCRLITNAGGLNPRGCAEACLTALADADCRPLRIGVVSGDDVLPIMRSGTKRSSAATFQNLDTDAAIRDVHDRLVTANAYLGAAPIVQALADGADIVITGRVADPSLTVAPAIYHFGWNENDLDRLAGASVAGHLIECGTQITGGISTDWLDVPDVAHIGFPVVEISQDGSCIVTKPHGTGGRVNELTVKEQLLYEIADPENYLSPDVTVSFLSLTVVDLGNDRVRVSGALGKPRAAKYKVSATYSDGFRAAGTLTIIGRNADTKARRVGQLVLQRVRDSGYELRDALVECLGAGDATGRVAARCGDHTNSFAEIVLRIAVEADARDAVECFASELSPFITAGPQGTTGYAEGRPRVHPVFRYWPCLIERHAVTPRVEILTTSKTLKATLPNRASSHSVQSIPPLPLQSTRILTAWEGEAPAEPNATSPGNYAQPSNLYDIAIARSGDKGSSATVGVIARTSGWWEFLRTWLTSDRVAEFLSALQIEHIDRYELPNLHALNFVLHGVLRQSLRTDAQGKALAQLLLELPLPENALRTISKGIL
ncbi:MAG TPA: acyclic terpene utilization AtuA family protein [Lacipirellulaceae bacterium]|nr:acyclic terpene utilization AtuA family protein [Lacipirellulaceae bacterium]